MMPGMEATGSSNWAILLRLAVLLLFWSGTALHLLRLVHAPMVPNRDRAADAAHAAMGAAMAYSLFPGSAAGLLVPIGIGFGAAGAGFGTRALLSRSCRTHSAVLAATSALMAVMLIDDSPGTGPGAAAAACLVGCAAYQLSQVRVVDTALDVGQARLLLTAPRVGAAVMTLGMAAMFLR